MDPWLYGQMLPASRKDVLPAIQKSSVIYEYKCHCDSRYVGRTAQRLQDRIKLHVLKWLRQHTASQRVQPNRACKRKQPAPECDSAIGQHLLENDRCAINYNDDQFSILHTARSLFHLSLLEASYIKVRRPNLCKQKEFAYTLTSYTVEAEVRFARLVQSELCVTFPRSIGFANVTTASCRPKLIFINRQTLLSRCHFDAISC